LRMARNLSNDARERIINAYKNQKSIKLIAEMYNCSESTVSRIVKAYNNEGRVEAKLKSRGRLKIITEKHKAFIRGLIVEDCAIILRNTQNKLINAFNSKASIATIDRKICSFAYILKRTTLIPERRNSPNNVESRYTTLFKKFRNYIKGNIAIFLL
jgi:transposase